MSNFFINHYLEHNPRREIKELYTAIAIKNFAFSMIMIFEPIFIYKIYNSISAVFLFYAVLYSLFIFVLPLGAKAAAKYGFEHCIFYSMPFAILYFLSLSQMAQHWWLIFFAFLFLLIYKTLFWPSYHADFAHYSITGYKGRELSALSFISTAAVVTGPMAGGIILTKFGFEVLFVIVSFISLISVAPLFATREKFEPKEFSYKKAFLRLIKPYGHYKRNDSFAYAGYGEEIAAAAAWPIFIILVIEKFYLMGILVSAAALVVSVISLYVGKLSDTLNKKGKKKLLRYSNILLSSSWILRPFSNNWLSILFVDIFSKGSKAGVSYPLFTYIYEAGENHRGYLKYVTFFEMSLTMGKILVAWTLFFFSMYLNSLDFWFYAFVFTCLWSLLFLFKFTKL